MVISVINKNDEIDLVCSHRHNICKVVSLKTMTHTTSPLAKQHRHLANRNKVIVDVVSLCVSNLKKPIHVVIS